MTDIYNQAAEAGLSSDETRALIDEVSGIQDAAQIDRELLELASYGRPTARQRVRHRLLSERQIGLMAAARMMGGDMSAADRPRGADGQLLRMPGQPGRPAGMDPARRVIEARHRDGSLPDYAAERAERLLGASAPDRGLAAAYIEAAGSPAYERAFMAYCADPARGHMMWDREEQDAYKAVQRIRNAMGTGTGAGGEMIPLTLDPQILITSAGSNNTLRQVARVVQTVTDSWQGVSSAGVTAEWKAENAQAAESSPALAAKPIPVYMGDTDAIFSYEVGMDAQNFQPELARVLQDAITQLQHTAYTTGTGTTQPKGYVPNAAAPTRTAGAFTANDVTLLQNSLPPRFSANAVWLANIAVINTIAYFETTNGSLKFPEVRQDPPRLLTKRLYENSNQSADMSTSASRFLAYGDFQQFVIVDRLGSMLEILPGYGANQRPSGQRHAFLTFRTGSDLVIPTAVQVIAKT